MELVGIENTVLTRLFLATRPEGQPYLPRAAENFVGRYKFAAFPARIEELSADRVSFKHGLFNDVAFDLDIFSDGVIVTSKSPSDVLDALLDDIITWMQTAIGLKKVETHPINTTYESYLIVHSAIGLLSILDGLAPVQKRLAKALKATTGRDASFSPVGWALSPDNTTMPSMKPIPFRVERRAGIPFETNYYYSCAPLRTADHLRVLEELERALS